MTRTIKNTVMPQTIYITTKFQMSPVITVRIHTFSPRCKNKRNILSQCFRRTCVSDSSSSDITMFCNPEGPGCGDKLLALATLLFVFVFLLTLTFTFFFTQDFAFLQFFFLSSHFCFFLLLTCVLLLLTMCNNISHYIILSYSFTRGNM